MPEVYDPFWVDKEFGTAIFRFDLMLELVTRAVTEGRSRRGGCGSDTFCPGSDMFCPTIQGEMKNRTKGAHSSRFFAFHFSFQSRVDTFCPCVDTFCRPIQGEMPKRPRAYLLQLKTSLPMQPQPSKTILSHLEPSKASNFFPASKLPQNCAYLKTFKLL